MTMWRENERKGGESLLMNRRALARPLCCNQLGKSEEVVSGGVGVGPCCRLHSTHFVRPRSGKAPPENIGWNSAIAAKGTCHCKIDYHGDALKLDCVKWSRIRVVPRQRTRCLGQNGRELSGPTVSGLVHLANMGIAKTGASAVIGHPTLRISQSRAGSRQSLNIPWFRTVTSLTFKSRGLGQK